MVTGTNEDIIWNLPDEELIDSDHIVFQYLSDEIDILEWKSQYWSLFKK